MNKKYLWALLLLALSSISLFAVTNDKVAQAKPATAVGLLSFEATPLDNAVLLEWETATEDGTLAFKLKRSQDDINFDYVIDPATGDDFLINSVGSVTLGAAYDYTDETVVNNTRYTYQLIELDSEFEEYLVEEVIVTVGVEPTATQVIVGGENGTSEPTATPRPATATATTASNSNATATAVPTNTIAPTVTSSQPLPTAPPLPSNTPAPGGGGGQGDTQATAVPTDSVKPTETIAVIIVEETTPGSDSNIAVVQAEEEAANPATNGSPIDSEAVQEEAITQAEGNTAASAIGDSSTTDGDANNPVAIGSDSQQSANGAYPAPAAQADNQDASGRAYLWGGFLVAILVFGLAVVGAIFLYTRKQNPGA